MPQTAFTGNTTRAQRQTTRSTAHVRVIVDNGNSRYDINHLICERSSRGDSDRNRSRRGYFAREKRERKTSGAPTRVQEDMSSGAHSTLRDIGLRRRVCLTTSFDARGKKKTAECSNAPKHGRGCTETPVPARTHPLAVASTAAALIVQACVLALRFFFSIATAGNYCSCESRFCKVRSRSSRITSHSDSEGLSLRMGAVRISACSLKRGNQMDSPESAAYSYHENCYYCL